MNQANKFKLFICGLFYLLLVNTSHAQDTGFLKRMKIITMQNSTPEWINFRTNININAASIFKDYHIEFGLANNDEMRLNKIQNDELGFKHYRYQQYCNGIKIDGCEFIVHVNNKGKVYCANGRMVSGLNKSVVPSINKNQAIDFAKKYFNSKQFMWESPYWENWLKQKTKDNNATYFPKPELVFYKIPNSKQWDSKNFKLAYSFQVFSLSPNFGKKVYVDATTGSVINTIPLELDCNPSNVSTIFNGNRSINTDAYQINNYRLKDDCQTATVRVRDWNSSTDNRSPIEITSSPNNWSSDNQRFGGSVLWASKQAYNYFLNIHGRNSYDNNNGILEAYINAVFRRSDGSYYTDNATMDFLNGIMKVGLGNGGILENSFAALDIIGHEYAHGVTGFSASLTYEGESGALNESFSDIFGETIENYVLGHNDFLLGNDRAEGFIRSMQNPKSRSQPNTYGGQYWIPTVQCSPTDMNDRCGVHTNSGVQNFWFYLLCNGGVGTNDNGYLYSVNGLGIQKARAIAYRNLTYYLTSSSVYGDAKIGSINATADLFGGGTSEVSSIIDAWCAVGLGTTCSPSVSDLTIINQQTSNTNLTAGVPFTVYFAEDNIGAASASPNYVSFHLSSNNILTPGNNGDFLVDDYYVNQTITPQTTTIALSKQITIPSNTPPGNYYLFFSADGSEIIDESDEQNNFATVQITVVAGTGCQAPVVSSPSSQTVIAPAGTSFSVNASGSGNTYQWQLNNGSGWANLLNGSPYSGVYSNTLSISSTNQNMSGYRYKCNVTNTCDNASSASATLTVNTSSTSCNNDFACSPKPININAACIVTSCTTVGANPPTSDIIYRSCSNTPYQTGRYDDDVWFSITPANTNPVTVKVTATSNLNNFDPVLGIYTGACLSLAQITGGCSDNPPGVPEQITFTPVAGTTYLLRVFSYGIGSTYSGNFDICVTAAGASGSNPLPDLESANESFSTTSICPGGSFQLNYDVENNGDASAGSSTVKYYLSSDNSYSGDDQLLGSTTVNSIGSGNDISKTKTLNIPSGTSNGSWYVLIVVDADNNVDEGNNGEGNNIYAKSISVSTCSLADIRLTYSGTPPTTGNVGVTIPVSFECTNIGGSITPPTRVGFYLSTDNIFDPKTDTYLDDEATNSLDPNETDDDNSGINISNCLPCGTYFIIMVADYQNLVSESDRSNNIYVFPYTFTGCVSCSISIPATGVSFQSAGGTGNIPVTAYECCPWTATTNDEWIKITNANGIGNGSVSYSVASCTGGTILNGSIIVNGQTYSITQNCTESCNNSRSFVWGSQAGSPSYSENATDLKVDTTGNIYMVGNIQGVSNFGNGIVLTVPGTSPDVFVSKHNANGEIQWAINFGNSGQETGSGIAKDKDENIYVVGSFSNSVSFGSTTLTSNAANSDAVFLVKLNPSGTVLWARKVNSSDVARGARITIDKNDNVFVTGGLTDAAVNFFISKYDKNGNQNWYRTYGLDNNFKVANGIECDNTGNIFVCGRFMNTISLGSIVLTAMATTDGFVTKLDPDGNVIWANQLSSPSTAQNSLASVTVDKENDVYVIGNVDSNVIVGAITIPLSKGNKAVIIKFDQNGNPIWAKASTEGYQYPTKVIKTNDEGIYFSGYFGNSFKMDSITLIAGGGNDAFLGKIDENEKVQWIKGFGGNLADEAYSIGLNKNSDVFVAGGFSGTVQYGNTTLTSSGSIDIFLAKFKQCDPPTASITYTGDAILCSGQSISLSANYCSNSSYQWFYNNNQIIGANNPAYTATQTGSYKVKVSAFEGCETLSNTIVLSSQTTFTFTGSGDWNNAGNWSSNIIPPSILPSCAEIIVNPQPGGECRLNVPQTISGDAKITVVTGSNFIIMGNLTINN